MTDYSHAALGGTGREPEEKMRVFLDCEKAHATGYDFSKGSVKFEYKHSILHERNMHSKERRSAPTRGWQFLSLRGQGGKKDYHHLILEGEPEGEGDSYLFLISFEELSTSFPTQNDIWVTLPMGGGRGRRLRGKSNFVWQRKVTKEELKARVDEYARTSGDAECSLRADVLGESHESARNAKKDSRLDVNYVERPGSTGTKSTLQLPLFFKR